MRIHTPRPLSPPHLKHFTCVFPLDIPGTGRSQDPVKLGLLAMQNLFWPTTLLLLSKRVRSNLVRTHWRDPDRSNRLSGRFFSWHDVCKRTLFFYEWFPYDPVYFIRKISTRRSAFDIRSERRPKDVSSPAPGPAEPFLMTRYLIYDSYYEAVFHQNLFLLPEVKRDLLTMETFVCHWNSKKRE